MRTTTLNDPRVSRCQHDRLRKALQWNGPSQQSISAKQPEFQVEPAPKFLKGAALSVLAALVWATIGATVTADFSDYGVEATTPQIVASETVASPSFDTP